MAANHQTFPNSASFRDSRGFVSTFRWWQTVDVADVNQFTDYAGVWTAVINAVVALSNAALIRVSGLPDFNMPDPASYGSSVNNYTAIFQKANMMFNDLGGKRHLYHIPAVKTTILTADLTTVTNDGSNASVVAFVNAMKNAVGTSYVSSRNTQGTATDSPGLPLVHFIGGHVVLGKQPKRFNEFIKSARLVQGEGF